jgi:hypothetical protein
MFAACPAQTRRQRVPTNQALATASLFSERQAEQAAVVSGDRFEFGFFRGLEGPVFSVFRVAYLLRVQVARDNGLIRA